MYRTHCKNRFKRTTPVSFGLHTGGVVEMAMLLLQPVSEMLIHLENVKAQTKQYVSTDTL